MQVRVNAWRRGGGGIVTRNSIKITQALRRVQFKRDFFSFPFCNGCGFINAMSRPDGLNARFFSLNKIALSKIIRASTLLKLESVEKHNRVGRDRSSLHRINIMFCIVMFTICNVFVSYLKLTILGVLSF